VGAPLNAVYSDYTKGLTRHMAGQHFFMCASMYAGVQYVRNPIYTLKGLFAGCTLRYG